MSGINIGITIMIKTPTESFFTNGIRQNSIILRDTFLKTGIVDNVYYVNMGNQKDLSQSPWKEYEPFIIDFDTALEKVNMILCVNVVLSGEHLEAGHKRGIKFVNHVMGNEYYAFSESILFKETGGGIITKQPHYSATWISPHLYETNKHLFEVLYEAPAYVGPYIWSPKFLMHLVEEEKKATGHNGLYKGSGKKEKTISVFEPNISMNKTCVMPIIIAEKLFNKKPELINKVNVFGSDTVKKKKELINFVLDLNINKAKKIFFESRYPIVWSLFNHTDVMLCHQQDIGLNYLYFDAAWLGYPVIHNAEFVKELGWYYNRFEADKAVKHLIEVVEHFDRSEQTQRKYIKKSRDYISQFLPEHEKNVAGYKQLLEKLF
jgi:hypothetical protein